MEPGRADSEKTAAFAGADATLHLRDHLECAQKLAESQDLPVIRYLIRMAILALCGPPAPSRQQDLD